MAFDVNSVAGDYAWSFLETAEGRVVANPDGLTYTLTSLNPLGSFQDQNLGFPSVVALHDLGLPGNPAFQPGDFTGERVSIYNPSQGIVELVRLDYQGNAEPVFIGGKVIAYGDAGFVVQQIINFVPLPGGGFLGDLGTGRILFANVPLNTFNADQNPITPSLTAPVTFNALFPTATVPEPSMGLVLGFLFLAAVAARSIFGRTRSAAA